MVKQADALLDKGDAQALSSLEDGRVVLAAGGSSDVLDTRASSAENVVDEGELLKKRVSRRSSGFINGIKGQTYESIAGNRNTSQLLHPSLALLGGKGRRDLVKDGLKGLALSAVLGELAADEKVNCVGLVGPLGALLPLDAQDALVEAHPPVVGLVAGEAGAVDAGLLAGAEANDLAVESVADRVALRVLEGDGGDGEIAGGALGQCAAVLGGDDGVEALGGRNLDVVAVLLECDAVDGTRLGLARVVLGVDLQDEVLAALLLLEDLERGVFVTGGNDTVRDLLGDDAGGGDVDNVGEGNDVAEAAHAVGATSAGIGLREARRLDAGDVGDHVDLALVLGEGQADGGTGGRDVLEAGCGGLAGGGLELLDKWPGVEGIEEVDVARGTTEGLEGQLGGAGIGGGGLLVRVGAVAEGQVLFAVTGVLLAEEVGDGSVVVGRVFKGLEGVSVAARLGDLALLELLEEASVVVGVREDGDTLVVLGGGTDESDSTNVDLLDGLGDADVDLGNSLLEGVQVADDIVDLVDVLVGEILLIRLEVAGEDAGVDGGVEGLDTAGEHLGGLCDGRNIPRKDSINLKSQNVERIPNEQRRLH